MRIHWILWCTCNLLYNDFTTSNNSKCCSVFYPLAVIYRGVLRSPILRVRPFQSIVVPIQSLLMTSQYLSIQSFCSLCRRLAAIPMSRCDLPIWRPNLWLGWISEVENVTNRNVDEIIPSRLYTHYKPPILHRLATIHNAAERRQTERSESAAHATASAV